jgi:hypothetical protein
MTGGKGAEGEKQKKEFCSRNETYACAKVSQPSNMMFQDCEQTHYSSLSCVLAFEY